MKSLIRFCLAVMVLAVLAFPAFGQCPNALAAPNAVAGCPQALPAVAVQSYAVQAVAVQPLVVQSYAVQALAVPAVQVQSFAVQGYAQSAFVGQRVVQQRAFVQNVAVAQPNVIVNQQVGRNRGAIGNRGRGGAVNSAVIGGAVGQPNIVVNQSVQRRGLFGF